MHHYPFHQGDYIKKTAHLSVEEDCAYRRLLDLYYETELPIPNETQTVSRRIRMATHVDVVGLVLAEFFILCDDGMWHSKHCDEVIDAYQKKCEHNKNAGFKGGRPKNNPNGFQTVSKRNPNQEPITNNQEPLKTKEKQKEKPTPSALLASLEISETVAQDFISLRNRLKAPITKTALAGIQREADKAGMTLQDALQVCCERSWRGFNAEWVKPKTNAPPAKSNVQDARLDCLNQIFRKGEYGTDRQIIDVTPSGSIAGNGENFLEIGNGLR